jgi:methionyl-tRNA formyltransferase
LIYALKKFLNTNNNVEYFIMQKQCLFLGYKKNQTSLINFLKKKNFRIKNYQKIPPLEIFKQSDFILSFGFRKIISKKIIIKLKKPIFNIHLSYLPFNRGAYPNFWSFIENTPAGVSINVIDEGIDTGNVILRKKVYFNTSLNKFSTFNKTYNFLFLEAEKLFKKNFNKIYSKRYKKIFISHKGTFHNIKDLPKWMKNWNMDISLAKKIYLSKRLY